MTGYRAGRMWVMAGLAMGVTAGVAPAQLRVVNWNVTNYNTTTHSGTGFPT